MWYKLRDAWDSASGIGSFTIGIIAVISPAIFIGGLIYIAATGDTEITLWRWVWRISAVVSLCDALYGIGYGIIKGVKSAKEIVPQRQKERQKRKIQKICKKKGHDWDGCICRRCGEKRDEEHDWNGCTCRRCGKTRDAEHDWDGCKCRLCGMMRDEEHDWKGCMCRRCGKKRNEGHVWELVELKDIYGCDYCEKKAGPGDWGMCMPETGGGCFGPGETYYDEVERCSICGIHK